MVTKLEMMVELSKCLKLGQPIPYKGMTANVLAFNDEGVFLTVPEVKVPPEEFEGPVDQKRIKDRELEEARREIHSLRNEIDKMLYDREYYEYRRRRDDRYHRQRRERMADLNDAMNLMMSPRFTGIYGGGEFRMEEALPKKEIWIDPLAYKQPSQKR